MDEGKSNGITSDDGKSVEYDVKEDMEIIDEFQDLKNIQGFLNKCSLMRAEPAYTGMIKLIYRVMRFMNMESV